MNRAINLLAVLALAELMLTIGLSARLADVVSIARDRGVVIRAILSNYVAVPALAAGLLWVFGAQPMVAVGLLIAAVCPGAPYGPPFTAIAKGNFAMSVGLMVILAASSAVLAPVLLALLLPRVAVGQSVGIDAVRLVSTLGLSQLAPLCAGLLIRRRCSSLANRLQGPCTGLSKALNLLLIGTIIVMQFGNLVAIRPAAYLGMAILLASTFAAGWLLGGGELADRKSTAITTAVRNVGLCLVIVTSSFPGTPAVTAAVTYGLFQTVVMLGVAAGLGRLAIPRASVEAGTVR